jgi:regulator of sigma E protease
VEFWLEPAFSVVNPRSPADRAGIEPGDRVLSAHGQEVRVWGDFVAVIQSRPGLETDLEILRDGEVLAVTVVPEAAEQIDPRTGQPRTVGQIGVLQAIDEVVYSRVGPLEAMGIGWDRTVFTTRLILGFLRDLVTGGVSPRSVGSIVTIGEASGQAADQGMDVFLSFMALFSVNLAILNLLPIPVLDGGHLVFLAIEAVRGRALSVEQRMRFSQVGFFVIIGIMLWALSNDFMRLFGL